MLVIRVVIDIEANGIDNPTKVWVICCLDLDTDQLYTFRRPSDDQTTANDFLVFSRSVSQWIGHNILSYDFPVLRKLLQFWGPDDVRSSSCIDTLIVSKLANYSRKSHSLESYGEELNFPKNLYNDWSKYSQELEDRCVTDVQLSARVYKYLNDTYISHRGNKSAIDTKQQIQLVADNLSSTGFAFDRGKAERLLDRVTQELGELDEEIRRGFPPRLHLIREITPTYTRYGTLHKKDFRWVEGGDLCEFNGGSFCRCELRPFNPNSVRQTVDILNNAGWKPTSKTKAHIEAIRTGEEGKLEKLRNTGWKINEENLNTLPISAPPAAKALARRILLESRRRTLTEWLGLVADDGRIHGSFQTIGAWTQRWAHQKPNMANIPNSHDIDGKVKLLGAEMRSLFIAPKNRLLVGVDAEGIQLRVFAHLIDDPEFTDAIVRGRKDNGTDPHSLNKRILGSVCRSRAAAKRFIYAVLLGGGVGKFSEILGCTREQAEEALARLMGRYTGFDYLKRSIIPKDARRGWFVGLDGRHISIPGVDVGEKRHLAMSGYLQSGENIIMEKATLKWLDKIRLIFPEEHVIKLVNFVHDEWQTEVPNDLYIARTVAELQCQALVETGQELKLKCPLAGSYGENHNDHKTWTIGQNWKVTH